MQDLLIKQTATTEIYTLSLHDALPILLGSKIKVRTLDGKRVVLKVPPGTQHGQKFRIPGQGIERNGRRGDQYVEIHVQIPEKLTPEQEAAVREFAEKSGMKH